MIVAVYFPYVVLFLVIVIFKIYNDNRNKTPHFIILEERGDCLTLILSLSLVPEFSKVPATTTLLSEIEGVCSVASSSNCIRIKKSSDFGWKKLSPEIKKVVKNNFKATLK